MTTMRFKDIESYRVWEAERSAEWSKPKPATEDKEVADPGKESKLQAKIEKWAKEKGYPCWHDRSKGKNRAGWPDLTLCMPNSRVVFLELKSAKGRMSEDQKQLQLILLHLDQEFYEIRSYKKFLEVING